MLKTLIFQEQRTLKRNTIWLSKINMSFSTRDKIFYVGSIEFRNLLKKGTGKGYTF
jgi:hypothetical protein